MQSHVELQVPSGDAGSAPTKVLLFAPAVLHATCGLALAFEGDSVLDPTAREDVGDALLQPEAHGRTLQAKLPRDHALAVVLPSRVTPDGFAAYDNFLVGTTLTGEPLGYKPQPFKAARHLRQVVDAIGTSLDAAGAPFAASSSPDDALDRQQQHQQHQGQQEQEHGQQGQEQWQQQQQQQQQPDHTTSHVPRLPPLTLIHFSKSGVVLNQLLTEMAELESTLYSVTPASPGTLAGSTAGIAGPGIALGLGRGAGTGAGAAAGTGATSTGTGAGAGTGTGAGAGARTTSTSAGTAAAAMTGTGSLHTGSASVNALGKGPAPQAGSWPKPVPGAAVASPPPDPETAAVLDSILAVHYLDAGLNGRGVHLTDPRLMPALGSRHTRRPLAVHFHGTPRQWQDRRRPWIAREKELSVTLLRGAQVPVTERLYFEGQPPSLKQHFEIIAAAGL